MATESAGYRKLAKLVSNHIFCDKHRDMLPTVMYLYGKSNTIRRYHRATRPGFDGSLVIAGPGLLNLVHQMQVNKRAFLQTSRHVVIS